MSEFGTVLSDSPGKCVFCGVCQKTMALVRPGLGLGGEQQQFQDLRSTHPNCVVANTTVSMV